MFTQIEIENFKCLSNFKKSLGDLTLFTGLNAAGKSSVTQVLTLIRQTVLENEWSKAFHLNGPSVQLGTMFDVIDRNSGGSGFKVGLSTEGWKCEWDTTSIDRKRDLTAVIKKIRLSYLNQACEWNLMEGEGLPLRRLIPESLSRTEEYLYSNMQTHLGSISHIGAERIGPRDAYAAQTPSEIPDVGTYGEKTAWCLEQFADDKINPGLALPGVPEFVRLTVVAWMERLFPGFQLELKRVEAANLITMGIRTSPRGDFFRPTNVGFGLTHVLPIFTACVSAKPNSLVIVENPESHLHPAGQSLAGYFLALAASQGVQILIETHSDHILNGVRKAIRDQRLAAKKTKIYFFRSDEGQQGETLSIVDNVFVEDNGRLRGWPPGFFDQLESDLDYIFRE